MHYTKLLRGTNDFFFVSFMLRVTIFIKSVTKVGIKLVVCFISGTNSGVKWHDYLVCLILDKGQLIGPH